MQWKTIKSNTAYEVSDMGLVRKKSDHKLIHPKTRPGAAENTTQVVTLYKGVPRKAYQLPLKDLVLHNFNPKGGKGRTLNIDGDQRNCRLDNLTYQETSEGYFVTRFPRVNLNEYVMRVLRQDTWEDMCRDSGMQQNYLTKLLQEHAEKMGLFKEFKEATREIRKRTLKKTREQMKLQQEELAAANTSPSPTKETKEHKSEKPSWVLKKLIQVKKVFWSN